MVQCGLTLLIPSPSVTSIERVIPKTSSLISAPVFVDRAEIGRMGEDEESRAGPRHTPPLRVVGCNDRRVARLFQPEFPAGCQQSHAALNLTLE
jgi:hypothetical protein